MVQEPRNPHVPQPPEPLDFQWETYPDEDQAVGSEGSASLIGRGLGRDHEPLKEAAEERRAENIRHGAPPEGKVPRPFGERGP